MTRLEMNPDWRSELNEAAQPVVKAMERELNAKIDQVIRQVRAEMTGCPADEIFMALRTRLSPDLPKAAFDDITFAARLRAEAQRISDSRQTPGVRGGAVRSEPGHTATARVQPSPFSDSGGHGSDPDR
jgi:hypothetical protein